MWRILVVSVVERMQNQPVGAADAMSISRNAIYMQIVYLSLLLFIKALGLYVLQKILTHKDAFEMTYASDLCNLRITDALMRVKTEVLLNDYKYIK